MKKSTFVAMILGTIGGILFALGMCMALIPEWNAFRPGVIMGVIGAAVLLLMVFVWRKMENKAPMRLSGKTIGASLMRQIEMLEKSKMSLAKTVSISVGVAGTIFMAGSTFAVTASPPIIWLCVLLAIPGFAGWILPYFFYKAIVSKRTEIVNPLIEDKYDEAYEICEKGSRLLGKKGGIQDAGSNL